MYTNSKIKKLLNHFDNFLTSNTVQHRYALRSLVNQEYKCIWGKTNLGMKRLQYEGVKLWNALPQDVKDAKSLREFSKKFKFMFFD